MTILQIILLVIFTVATVWQAWILYIAGQYVRAKASNVRIGVLPGIVAVIAGTALLVVSR